MALAPFYRECFVVTNVVKDEEGNYKLDLPFPITGQEVICNGINYYHLIPQIDGQEVIAHIFYATDYDFEVRIFKGYLGNCQSKEEREKIMAHPKYTTHWKQTLAESKATLLDDNTVVPYKGEDKDKPSPCSVFLMNDYIDK